MNNVMYERGKQYGSFKTNMANVEVFKRLIQVYKEDPVEDRVYTHLTETVIPFIHNMLSLKCARSLMARGESLDDCIVDFINYMNLAEKQFGLTIKLDKEFFKPNLSGDSDYLEFDHILRKDVVVSYNDSRGLTAFYRNNEEIK